MCFCRAHYLMLAVVVLLGLASLLSACGARGDLYLPKKPQQTEQKQTPAQPPLQNQTEPQSQSR